MEFRILGSLEIVDNGRRLPLSGPKQRALLAALLLQPNEVVSIDRLIDALWSDRPPATALAALQVHVSQLRKVLGAERIVTRAPGYLLRVGAEELDLTRFERLSAEGRAHEALDLWRGPPLEEFAYDAFAQGEIARLEELRLTTVEERIDADLEAGRQVELVAELESLVHMHPLRERLRAQLMLALYRCGRQADALQLYHETRRLLIEEIGVEPGPELRELDRRILNHDESLSSPALGSPPTADKTDQRQERKVVTVVFADLVGFTARAEQLDPEDVSAVLSQYHLRLRAELERHGGTVEKFVGDAVMALFGAPAAHEDDAERAVRAALAIRDWIAEQGEDLQVRIAVHSGEALVRLGAHPAAGEGMAVGDVVNTAARLQQAAPPGAVVVGEVTHRATKNSIAYDPLDPVEVKGKAERVPLWLARDLRGAAELDRAWTPLVGRSDDLALLKQTHTRAVRESSVQLVTIVGEPGIGKTRLVGELHSLLEQEQDHPLWRQGRCLPYGEGITFWALGEIVKTQAGILESDASELAAAKLAAAVDRVAERSDRLWLYRRLAPLVGAEPDDESVAQAEAFAGWRTFLEGVAAAQPLVLVFEDLHWADSALLAFLDHLVEWSADVPLLVVGTARPELYERDPGWGGGKRNSTTIALAPLDDEQTAELVSELLSRAELPVRTQAALLERAGGNPLYAEEFVRMLADRGLLTSRDGAVEVAGETDIPVPEGVHAVIAARLDTLEPSRKSLLHDAAVVGKVFWAGALSTMGREPTESVLAGLHELGRKELIRRSRTSSVSGDVEYTFWHVLVRDVAYAQIPRAARARKHVAAAEWIERIAGERATDHAEFLAHHYHTALELSRATGDEHATTLFDAAVRFGALAAQRAARLDHARGERYYRQTLALLPDDDPRRPKLLADAADVGTTAGTSFEQIKAELEEAIAALQAQGDLVGAANALRQLSFAMYGRRGSLDLADGARRLLEPGPPTPELARVYARLAQEQLIAGRPSEGLDWAEQALPLLERFGLRDELLQARLWSAAARCELGDARALADVRKIAQEAVDPEQRYATHVVTNALNNLAWAEQLFGAGSAASAAALRAASDLAGRRGLERPAHWYRANLIEALYDLGDWDEALRSHEEIATWEQMRGRSMIGVIGVPSVVKILTGRGELDAAAALVEELIPRARDVEGPGLLVGALAAAATLESTRGEPARAVEYVEEVARLAANLIEVLAAIPELGRVCAATGELSLLEQVLALNADSDPRLGWFLAAGRASLAEARGDHAHAEPLFAEAIAGHGARGAVVERAHALFGLGRCLLAAGRRAEAAGPMQEAAETFRKLGASQLAAKAEALLPTSKVGT